LHYANRAFGFEVAHTVGAGLIPVIEDDRLAVLSLTIFLRMNGILFREAADGGSCSRMQYYWFTARGRNKQNRKPMLSAQFFGEALAAQ
jgi:hypothetical protein